LFCLVLALFDDSHASAKQCVQVLPIEKHNPNKTCKNEGWWNLGLN